MFHRTPEEKIAAELIKIQTNGTGGMEQFQVQLVLAHYFTEEYKNSSVKIPAITELSGSGASLPLSGWQAQGYQYVAFSIQANVDHQIAVWIQLGSKHQITLIDSLSNALPNKKVLAQLTSLFSDEPADNIDIKMGTSHYARQSDNWSCGVHVIANIIAQYQLATTGNAPQDKKLNVSAELKNYFARIKKQISSQENLGKVAVENFQKKRILLEAIETIRKEQKFYGLEEKESSDDRLRPIADFLQLELWGNLDRTNPERNNQATNEIVTRSAATALLDYRLKKELIGAQLLLINDQIAELEESAVKKIINNLLQKTPNLYVKNYRGKSERIKTRDMVDYLKSELALSLSAQNKKADFLQKLVNLYVNYYANSKESDFIKELLNALEITEAESQIYSAIKVDEFNFNAINFILFKEISDQLISLDEYITNTKAGVSKELAARREQTVIKLKTIFPIEELELLNAMAINVNAIGFINQHEKILIDAPDEIKKDILSIFSKKECSSDLFSVMAEMSTKNKILFFNHCLSHQKSQEDKNLFLEKLADHAELFADHEFAIEFQQICLFNAAKENNITRIKELVAHGADLNLVLDLLIAQRDDEFIDWLVKNPEMRLKINENYLLAIDQLLQEEKCPVMVGGKLFDEWEYEQEEKNESPSRSQRFFVERISKNKFLKLAKEFLQSVVYGEQENAEKILQNNPNLLEELLTTKIKVKDYSGRKIYGTALQIAMGAKDVGYQPGEECMVEMLQKHLKKLANGEKIIAEQITEQFPEGFEEQEQARIKRDKKELDKIIKAIAESECKSDSETDWDEPLKLAFENFRNYLKPKGVIKTGYHFNEQLFLDACKLYDEKYTDFGGRDSLQNNISWRKVIGGTQRLFPANLGQAFCTGLGNIVDDGKCVRRLLKLGDGGALYPDDLSKPSGLGFDFAIYSYRRGLARGRSVRGAVNGDWIVDCDDCALRKLMSNKNKKLGELMRSLRISQRRESGCVIS